jgi:hypothetical protein
VQVVDNQKDALGLKSCESLSATSTAPVLWLAGGFPACQFPGLPAFIAGPGSGAWCARPGCHARRGCFPLAGELLAKRGGVFDGSGVHLHVHLHLHVPDGPGVPFTAPAVSSVTRRVSGLSRASQRTGRGGSASPAVCACVRRAHHRARRVRLGRVGVFHHPGRFQGVGGVRGRVWRVASGSNVNHGHFAFLPAFLDEYPRGLPQFILH